jgi:cobalamin biosynthesis Co2+ chelatase CbiK
VILTVRYPHVRDLVQHYANNFSDQKALEILKSGLSSEDDAKYLSHFIWKMIDRMSEDRENGIKVLSGIDNTSMLPDVAYELDVLMADNGYSHIWEEISDQA